MLSISISVISSQQGKIYLVGDITPAPPPSLWDVQNERYFEIFKFLKDMFKSNFHVVV